jgi:hypothetical protein
MIKGSLSATFYRSTHTRFAQVNIVIGLLLNFKDHSTK